MSYCGLSGPPIFGKFPRPLAWAKEYWPVGPMRSKQFFDFRPILPTVRYMTKVDSKAQQRILAAALKQFADHGYAGASVQAIVDAARVKKPTLYYYFENKAALCRA